MLTVMVYNQELMGFEQAEVDAFLDAALRVERRCGARVIERGRDLINVLLSNEPEAFNPTGTTFRVPSPWLVTDPVMPPGSDPDAWAECVFAGPDSRSCTPAMVAAYQAWVDSPGSYDGVVSMFPDWERRADLQRIVTLFPFGAISSIDLLEETEELNRIHERCSPTFAPLVGALIVAVPALVSWALSRL